MEIRKGSSRIAFRGKNLTCKIPFFPPDRLKLIPGDLRLMKQMYGWKGLADYFTDTEDLTSFQQRFMAGWLANIREALWSRRLGDAVVPTHFSLGGFLNIQSSAEKCNGLDQGILRKVIKAEIGAPLDAHTFFSPENYGIHDENVKLLDYGYQGVGDSILKYRDAFKRALAVLTSLTGKEDKKS